MKLLKFPAMLLMVIIGYLVSYHLASDDVLASNTLPKEDITIQTYGESNNDLTLFKVTKDLKKHIEKVPVVEIKEKQVIRYVKIPEDTTKREAVPLKKLSIKVSGLNVNEMVAKPSEQSIDIRI